MKSIEADLLFGADVEVAAGCKATGDLQSYCMGFSIALPKLSDRVSWLVLLALALPTLALIFGRTPNNEIVQLFVAMGEFFRPISAAQLFGEEGQDLAGPVGLAVYDWQSALGLALIAVGLLRFVGAVLGGRAKALPLLGTLAVPALIALFILGPFLGGRRAALDFAAPYLGHFVIVAIGSIFPMAALSAVSAPRAEVPTVPMVTLVILTGLCALAWALARMPFLFPADWLVSFIDLGERLRPWGLPSLLGFSAGSGSIGSAGGTWATPLGRALVDWLGVIVSIGLCVGLLVVANFLRRDPKPDSRRPIIFLIFHGVFLVFFALFLIDTDWSPFSLSLRSDRDSSMAEWDMELVTAAAILLAGNFLFSILEVRNRDTGKG